MAFESNYVTFIGNLTDDPELRFTQGGHAVCTVRLANNHKYTAGGQEREETTYLNVVAWRELADNIAETFSKGDRAVAIGKLKVRSYENKDGQTVWVTEIEADEVAPSLRWAKATIDRNSGGSGGPRGESSTTPAPPSDDDVPF
jgi:single-strand DNA-binding protein